MSDLIVISFPDEDTARRALGSIRLLERDGRLGLEDTAVVTKAADGTVTVKNEMSSGTETGAAVGAVLGALVTVAFPVGVIAGAIVGGLIGRAAKPGVDADFVKKVETELQPGGSALFLLAKGGVNAGMLIGAMRQYEGTVIQTSLDDEEERALRESLR
jgi:uncharacterized membrane protein